VLDLGEHLVLVEDAAFQVGIFPGQDLQLAAGLAMRRVDVGVRQPMAVVIELQGIDDVQVLFALLDGLLVEGGHDGVFLVAAVEECTDVEMFQVGPCLESH
jgi:hypothetical protein